MDQQVIVCVVLVFAIIGFILEDFITPVATVLCVVLALFVTGVLKGSQVATGLGNSAVVLTGVTMVFGGALVASGAANKIGLAIVARVKSERNIVLVLMLLGTFLAAFISGIGTITILTPLSIAICQANRKIRLSKLLIPCFIACTTGGMITTIGKPGQMLIKDLLMTRGYGTLGFFELGKVGLPISIAVIVFIYFIGINMLPDTKVDVDAKADFYKSEEEMPKHKVIILIGIFTLLILGLVFEEQIGWPNQVVCFAGILLLFIGRVVSEKQMYSYVGWRTLFVLAGMLPLSAAMDSSGLAKTIGDWLVNFMGGNPSPFVVMLIFFVALGLTTEFMSNTALVAMFAPIGFTVAEAIGANVIAMSACIALASSCAFMIPFGAPFAAYVYEIGGYKLRDYLIVGAPLNIFTWIVGATACVIFFPY